MVEITDTVGKPNPHRSDLLPAVGISRVHQPGIKKAACHSKAEPFWEELAYLHWISTSQQSMFSQKVGFPVRKGLLALLDCISLQWR